MNSLNKILETMAFLSAIVISFCYITDVKTFEQARTRETVAGCAVLTFFLSFSALVLIGIWSL